MRLLPFLAALALAACTTRLDLGNGCETDLQFCARQGKDCGTWTGPDDCGRARTVACGTCTLPQQCGARGRANVCGFVGIAWQSGAGTADPDAFARWRGQPVEVLSAWGDITSWAAIEDVGALAAAGPGAGRNVSYAQALMPSTEGDLFACAAGQYTGHFSLSAQSLARRLAEGSWGKAYLRLGWQDNEACRWCPKSAAEDEAWKSCFQDAWRAFKAVSPDFVVLWDMNRRIPGDVTRLWPGDAYVDVVAVDFYDMAPGLADQRRWDADFASLDGQGPRGLGAWVDFARRHGKKLALPEWGISSLDPSGGGDDSFFVEKLYDFFWRHADDLEYEALFNLQGRNYQLFPISDLDGNPNAGNRYLLLWSPR
jgi:hypothetical protein